MAMLASLPATRHFFNPTVKRVNGVDHMIIGKSEDEPGIRPERIDELQDFLYTSFFKGVTIDFSEFDNTRRAMQDSRELTTRKERVTKAQESRSFERASAVTPNHRLRLSVSAKGSRVTPHVPTPRRSDNVGVLE